MTLTLRDVLLRPCSPGSGRPEFGIRNQSDIRFLGIRRGGRIIGEAHPPAGWIRKQTIKRIDSAFYGGTWSPSFGHFILETLSRMSFEILDSELPIIFSSTAENRFRRFQEEITTGLGLKKERIIFTESPVLVRRLRVNPMFSVLYRGFEPDWLEFMASFAQRTLAEPAPSPSTGERVWFHRSGHLKVRDWHPRRSAQLSFETQLRNAGWIIARPEEFSVRRLVETFTTASAIGGVAGSWQHAIVLAPQAQPKANILLGATEALPITYPLLAEATGLRQKRITI